MKYYYDIFLSYSHKDKDIAEKIYEELKIRKYIVWLDAKEIYPGDNLVKKISDGLENSRYLALLLTNNSVASRWVEEEWQSKYLEEINSASTVILPLLTESCEVPFFLRKKRYADFRHSFEEGLKEVLTVLSENSSVTVDYFLENLLLGKDVVDSARRLGDVILKSNDENALYSLWNILCKKESLDIIVDHCIYTFKRIVLETENINIINVLFDIFDQSIFLKSEIIIDKISYVIGDLAIQNNNADIKKRALNFIKRNINSENPFIEDSYKFTLNRVTRN